MYAQGEKPKENKSRSAENTVTQKMSNVKQGFGFGDNRLESVAQRKLQEMVNNNSQTKKKAQLQAIANNYSALQLPIQEKENNSGLPDKLKTGIENLSGYTMYDVKPHNNSDKPTQLQANTAAEYAGIHVASGQEKQIPYEARYLAQQKRVRVKPTMQMKCKENIKDYAGLEKEAEAGELIKVGHKTKKLDNQDRHLVIDPQFKKVVQKQKVIQRYLIYNAGAGLGQYQTHGGANFTSQVTGAGGNSFIDPLNIAPRLQNQVAPAVRISQNGRLAIEDANLTGRQPKFFYADAAMVPAWNDTLLAQGSFYELVIVPGPTLGFTMIGGAVRNLVKIEARNKVSNNQGLNMTTAQQCYVTVREVLGSLGSGPIPTFQNAPMPLPAMNPAYQTIIQHYYLAAELAYEAAGGGAGGGGVWGVGGMPVGGVNFENPNPTFNAVSALYGNAMNAHLGGVINANLDLRMQHLGVNEYVDPEVGQGLVTNTLGSTTPVVGGTQLNDPYNARVVPNPNNNNMWGFHWAGVIAKDAPDYITLENYARNAEDNHLQLSPNDPRFYFQMYGGAAQSWHSQWAAIRHGGREFVNPLSTVVAVEENAAVYNERASRNFGNNINAIRNDHNTLAVAGATNNQLRIGLLKGLAYANHIVGHRWRLGNRTRVNAWVTAVTNIANPAINILRAHVLNRLGQIRITYIGGW